MVPLGGTYVASWDVRDPVTGELTNPDTITLTITQPDGTVVSPAPVIPSPPPSVGQFIYLFVPVQSGRHIERWVTTSPATAKTDVFDVGLAAPPTILSLADAKKQLGMEPDFTDDDDELREKLVALTKGIEDYKLETIPMQTVVEEHVYGGLWGRGWPLRTTIKLWKRPTISLTSVVTKDGTFTWDVANLDLDTTTGLVAIIKGPPIRGRVVVTYVVGYQVIPDNYLEGAKVLLQYLWEDRRGPGGAQGVLGPDEIGRSAADKSALPKRVKDWLGPPRPVVA